MSRLDNFPILRNVVQDWHPCKALWDQLRDLSPIIDTDENAAKAALLLEFVEDCIMYGSMSIKAHGITFSLQGRSASHYQATGKDVALLMKLTVLRHESREPLLLRSNGPEGFKEGYRTMADWDRVIARYVREWLREVESDSE